jgi:hypothetical protein
MKITAESLDLTGISESFLRKNVSNFKFSTLNREKIEAIHRLICEDTTKICPLCLNTELLELRTQNLKICPDCDTRIDWNLEPRQRPLL